MDDAYAGYEESLAGLLERKKHEVSVRLMEIEAQIRDAENQVALWQRKLIVLREEYLQWVGRKNAYEELENDNIPNTRKS